MRRRRIAKWLGMAALAFLAAASAGASEPQKPFRRVTDETGRIVNIPSRVRRIVSLAPNLTETIYALGAQGRLVGDTEFCDNPPEARQKPHIGLPVDPSLEMIAGLRPDLVLATTAINRRETVDALAQLGIPVYATDPHTVDDMLESILHIGDVIGARAQAEALVARLRQRLAALRARLAGRPAKRVLFIVWTDPLISAGQNTFIADALRWAGAESVIHTKQNWPQVSLEEVVRLAPDFLIYAGNHTESGDEGERRALRTERGWRDLRAVREGHIAIIGNEVDRPAPGLVDAIEQLARELHPSAFLPAPENPAAKGKASPREAYLWAFSEASRCGS